MNDEHRERLESEIDKLRDEQTNMQRTLDAMSTMLVKRVQKEAFVQRKIVARLGHLEGTARDSAKILRELVKSRIWKTLTAAGGVMLRMVPSSSAAKGVGSAALTEAEKLEHIQMRCDSIHAESIDPVAGKIEITGWAISPDGIESLELSVGTHSLRVRYGNPRPDIEALFPHIKNSDRSGFAAGFDTRDVTDGIYRIKLRATSRKGHKREVDLPLIVNQEIGVLGEYSRWLEVFEDRDADLVRVQLAGFRYRPLVSVLVPVYRTNLDILRETIDSVKAQSYTNWELCLADDGSDIPELTAFLETEAASDSRIHVVSRLERGGISAASNDALDLAIGDYIALLDHDDLLTEDALFHMVNELQSTERPDLLYSDEDHIDESGRPLLALLQAGLVSRSHSFRELRHPPDDVPPRPRSRCRWLPDRVRSQPGS